MRRGYTSRGKTEPRVGRPGGEMKGWKQGRKDNSQPPHTPTFIAGWVVQVKGTGGIVQGGGPLHPGNGPSCPPNLLLSS